MIAFIDCATFWDMYFTMLRIFRARAISVALKQGPQSTLGHFEF